MGVKMVSVENPVQEVDLVPPDPKVPSDLLACVILLDAILNSLLIPRDPERKDPSQRVKQRVKPSPRPPTANRTPWSTFWWTRNPTSPTKIISTTNPAYLSNEDTDATANATK